MWWRRKFVINKRESLARGKDIWESRGESWCGAEGIWERGEPGAARRSKREGVTKIAGVYRERQLG